jgi:hypothetical protein
MVIIGKQKYDIYPHLANRLTFPSAIDIGFRNKTAALLSRPGMGIASWGYYGEDVGMFVKYTAEISSHYSVLSSIHTDLLFNAYSRCSSKA